MTDPSGGGPRKKQPRIVAELGRPETPDETARRKAENTRKHHANQTAVNLTLSIVASLAVVLFLVLVVVRPSGTVNRQEIDYQTVAESAESNVDVRADEVVRAVARGEELVARAVERAHTRVSELTAQLRALSPQGTLRRGYSIVQLPGGGVLRDPADAPESTPLVLTVEGGALQAVSTGASSPGPASSPSSSSSSDAASPASTSR